MAEFQNERQLVLLVESRMAEWTNRARRDAYAELFEGEDAILSPDELRRLDALDSAMERQGGDGVWGTGQYGIQTARLTNPDTDPGVVCTYHPRITSDSVLQSGDDLDDETEERLNAALWEYGERVADIIQGDLRKFVREVQQ